MSGEGCWALKPPTPARRHSRHEAELGVCGEGLPLSQGSSGQQPFLPTAVVPGTVPALVLHRRGGRSRWLPARAPLSAPHLPLAPPHLTGLHPPTFSPPSPHRPPRWSPCRPCGMPAPPAWGVSSHTWSYTASRGPSAAGKETEAGGVGETRDKWTVEGQGELRGTESRWGQEIMKGFQTS